MLIQIRESDDGRKWAESFGASESKSAENDLINGVDFLYADTNSRQLKI